MLVEASVQARSFVRHVGKRIKTERSTIAGIAIVTCLLYIYRMENAIHICRFAKVASSMCMTNCFEKYRC